MLPDYSALAEAVQRWALLAGVQVDHVLLSFHERPVLVLPITEARSDDSDLPDRGRGLSPCHMDIVAVLESHKPNRLSTMRVMTELAKAGKEWSKTHVESQLRDMMRDGMIDNPAAAKPRGYQLTA